MSVSAARPFAFGPVVGHAAASSCAGAADASSDTVTVTADVGDVEVLPGKAEASNRITGEIYQMIDTFMGI